jgi:hypothetical protein
MRQVLIDLDSCDQSIPILFIAFPLFGILRIRALAARLEVAFAGRAPPPEWRGWPLCDRHGWAGPLLDLPLDVSQEATIA